MQYCALFIAKQEFGEIHPSASLVYVHQNVGVQVELYYLNQLVLEGRNTVLLECLACL